MSCYESLAGAYDALTGDVGYEKRADYLEKLFKKSKIEVKMVLDLACGTGTMSCILAGRGYELIGADGSEDMLAAAMQKASEVQGIRPIFLQQYMQELDLYGTVDAVICCLDSINYLTRVADIKETLRRIHLFLAPGGILIFDINSPFKLQSLDNQIFLDESEDVYCVWRAAYEKRSKICTFGMDIFEKQGSTWERSLEEHYERAWEVDELTSYLTAAGFENIKTYGDRKLCAPKEEELRIYFTCIRGENKK